ncbi:MAG: DUF167 domain-containing protein [Treponema sp.]|nr:DUF167 domain-containing protein [Treponema sp.]
MNCYKIKNDYICIDLKVSPGSSKNEVTGVRDNRLYIRIAGQPQDGRANSCLCEFLAKTLGCAKRDVVLVKGEKSRMKTVKAPLTCGEKLKEICIKRA